MIRYALRCNKGHDFDGWFRSAAGFDTLSAEGQVSCSICGSNEVAKAPMAPAIPRDDSARPLDNPGSALEQAMRELRRHVEENSDYVGESFVTTARAMHEGKIPERLIHGEARPDEARQLLEDGVPVAPLPFRATRKLS